MNLLTEIKFTDSEYDQADKFFFALIIIGMHFTNLKRA